ncbi:exodeoxyribonuclease III [Parvularcula flava]|uniref:Exodeoxyribonuclease III n=1 Tax=Aquisalinus luteolus TaxID=1566827 RepID=A0ABX0HN01_9PROT|nr:exodeoxyribonuclease III [Aquisalinus luteolus]
MTMKITTWNINSVRLRIGLVERFLKEESPDILCLQEIKCLNDQFPRKAFEKAGYPHIAVHGQKGYHGVAIASRTPFEEERADQFCSKEDCRHIAIRLKGNVHIHNFYVPAGGDEPDPAVNDKFAHKLDFMTEMAERFADTVDKKSILVGDLNVAPREHDVWSHKQLLKVVSHTPVEVEHMARIIERTGWVDVARELIPEPEKLYTWWSYRAKDWKASNRGRRLDHIWVTPALKKAALAGGRDAYTIHEDARSWEKPSDHAPVSLTLAL